MAELQFQFKSLPLVIVMGVSGCGKSSVGRALAQQFCLPYLEADEFHPPENVDKMSRGVPLSDDDRWPWLKALSHGMVDAAEMNGGVIASCSALKRIYREFILEKIDQPALFVFLDGDRETIYSRMQARSDHYMPPSLLDSQFADLERPDQDEPVLSFSIEQTVNDLVEEISAALATYKR